MRKVILKKAKSTSSPVFIANQTESYTTDLLGDYQNENLATANMALQVLTEFDVDEKHMQEGFRAVAKNTGLQGRWQIIADSPKVIVDVAHNEAGIAAVMNQLKSKNYPSFEKNINYSAALTPKFTNSLRQLSSSFVIGVKSL